MNISGNHSWVNTTPRPEMCCKFVHKTDYHSKQTCNCLQNSTPCQTVVTQEQIIMYRSTLPCLAVTTLEIWLAASPFLACYIHSKPPHPHAFCMSASSLKPQHVSQHSNWSTCIYKTMVLIKMFTSVCMPWGPAQGEVANSRPNSGTIIFLRVCAWSTFVCMPWGPAQGEVANSRPNSGTIIFLRVCAWSTFVCMPWGPAQGEVANSRPNSGTIFFFHTSVCIFSKRVRLCACRGDLLRRCRKQYTQQQHNYLNKNSYLFSSSYLHSVIVRVDVHF